MCSSWEASSWRWSWKIFSCKLTFSFSESHEWASGSDEKSCRARDFSDTALRCNDLSGNPTFSALEMIFYKACPLLAFVS